MQPGKINKTKAAPDRSPVVWRGFYHMGNFASCFVESVPFFIKSFQQIDQ